MKNINLIYNDAGFLKEEYETDSLYIAKEESNSVVINATFPAFLAGTVRAYMQFRGGGDVVECGNINLNQNTATLTLSANYLTYDFLKVGFEVITSTKEIRFEPVILEVDDFVNIGGNTSAQGYTVTVKVGEVITLPSEEKAYVKNVGTTKDAVFDFGIPHGYTPIKGVDYYTDAEKEELFEETREVAKEVVDEKAVEIEETATGKSISVTDSANAPLKGLKLFGKTMQNITTGKNLLKFPYTGGVESRSSGIVYTLNHDTSIKLEGNLNGYSFYSIYRGAPITNTSFVFNVTGFYRSDIGCTGAIVVKLYTEKGGELLAELQCYNDDPVGTYIVVDMTKYPTATYITISLNIWGVVNSPISGTVKPIVVGGNTYDGVWEAASGGKAGPKPYNTQEIVNAGGKGQIGINVTGNGITQSSFIPTPNGLAGIPVTSGGNYTDEEGQQWICDVIDLERAVYIQNIGKLVIDGETNKVQKADEEDYTYYFPTSLIRDRVNSYCTHFTYYDNYPYRPGDFTVRGSTSNKDDGIYFSGFGIVEHYSTESADEFNNWLYNQYVNETPVTVYFVLAEPTETPLTDEQIKSYNTLTTYKPATNIINDENVGIEICYTADTKTYIDNKFEELKNAIISTGGNV